jgi:hypothetical protein
LRLLPVFCRLSFSVGLWCLSRCQATKFSGTWTTTGRSVCPSGRSAGMYKIFLHRAQRCQGSGHSETWANPEVTILIVWHLTFYVTYVVPDRMAWYFCEQDNGSIRSFMDLAQ